MININSSDVYIGVELNNMLRLSDNLLKEIEIDIDAEEIDITEIQEKLEDYIGVYSIQEF